MMNTGSRMSIFSMLLQLQNGFCLANKTCAIFQHEIPINAADDHRILTVRKTEYVHQTIETNLTRLHMSKGSCIYRVAITNYLANNTNNTDTGILMEYSNEDRSNNCSQADIGYCKTVDGQPDSASAIICCYHWDGVSIYELWSRFLVKIEKEANNQWVLLLETTKTEQPKQKNSDENAVTTGDSNDVTAGIIVGCSSVIGLTLVLLVYIRLRRKRRNKFNWFVDPYGLGPTAEPPPDLASFFQTTSSRESAYDDDSESHALTHDETDESRQEAEAEDKKADATAIRKDAYYNNTETLANPDASLSPEIDENKNKTKAEDKNVYATATKKDARVKTNLDTARKTKPGMRSKTAMKTTLDSNIQPDTDAKSINTTITKPVISTNDDASMVSFER